MTFLRWLPTLLAFPLGGLLAEAVGPLDSPVSGLVGGLLVGVVIGAAQWLALRSRGIDLRWVPYTAVGTAAGTALAFVLTGGGTRLADLMLTGLVAGAAVGLGQAIVLGRGGRASAVWAAVTAASWSLGWLTTWAIGVDVERGYHVFGSSGAVLVTVLTGLALRAVLGPAVVPARPTAVVAQS
jgi:hypothetical protein